MKRMKVLATLVTGVMEMRGSKGLLALFLLGAVALGLGGPGWAAGFEEARIFIEYNSSDNDLGFHVFLDAENWKSVKIVNPAGTTIFEVEGKGPYANLGLTELFFEGAEPSLDEFPLNELLALFPEGKYQFIGTTVDGKSLVSTATLTHAVPDGPSVSSEVNGDSVIIRWDPVTGPPGGFPQRKIDIVGYQILVERQNPHRELSINLPAAATSVTVPPEFLEPNTHYAFEVLAIEAGGNQTITEGAFETN